MGGLAVAEVLFGEISPAGRLPISIPVSAAQLPVFYNHTRVARRPYVFDTSEPLYPFGFGLSYTSFNYSNLAISPAEIGPDESCEVKVDVTNTGKVAGDEVVQLYLKDEVATVTRPVHELKGFRRIHLAPGETRTVTMRLGPEELKILDINMQWTVEPGIFTVKVGGNQQDVVEGTLTVVQ